METESAINVVLSTDKKLAYVASQNGISTYDIKTLKRIRLFRLGRSPRRFVPCTNDRLIAFGTEGAGLYLLDISTNKVQELIYEEEEVPEAEFAVSPHLNVVSLPIVERVAAWQSKVCRAVWVVPNAEGEL